jgi:hypothetical protein
MMFAGSRVCRRGMHVSTQLARVSQYRIEASLCSELPSAFTHTKNSCLVVVAVLAELSPC